jgi:hypothetical protein
MERYLARVTIPVYIHDVQVAVDYVPEHVDAKVPTDFHGFFEDIRQLANSQTFSTSKDSTFRAALQTDNSLVVEHESGKRDRIDGELLEASWIRLRDRILSIDSFSDEKSQRLKSYLFPILAELPYVRSVKSRSGSARSNRAEALFIDRDRYQPYVAAPTQGCLFP